MTLPANLRAALDRVKDVNRPTATGRVHAALGLAVEVEGLRGALGDLVTVHAAAGPVLAEVVGFREERAVVMPLEDAHGIAPLDAVEHRGEALTVPVGDGLLGRVLDALGRPLDGGPPPGGARRRVESSAPSPLQRAPIDQPLVTGVSAIDGMLTLGRGQRIGIFAGSGVGKSTLLGNIAKHGSAEVNVIALIGERGREVEEFLREVLGPEGMARSVVVAATSDTAPMQRLKGPFTAVAIAEAFREQGRDVLFMMDSVTRFAGAAREVGLAAGEPPTLRGYPPSLFAKLPRLVERLGNDHRGSITGLLTVLVDGDDLNEPVSDALRGYLDGHVVLSRSIAHRGNFPAIDVLGSVSRLMDKVTPEDQQRAARELRRMLALYEENRDLVQVGAYRKGSDVALDRAIGRISAIEGFLHQGNIVRSVEETRTLLAELVGDSTGPLGMADR